MTQAAIALQAAIYSTLVNDQALIAILGGAFVFDHVPRRQRPPYIAFSNATHQDWSTGTEEGTEHNINLDIWSRQKGRNEALEIAEAANTALRNIPQTVTGHEIVNFRNISTDVRRDEKTDYFLATLRFRVVTEPTHQTGD